MIIQFCSLPEFVSVEHVMVIKSFSAAEVIMCFVWIINSNQVNHLARIFHHENSIGCCVVSSNLSMAVAKIHV